MNQGLGVAVKEITQQSTKLLQSAGEHIGKLCTWTWGGLQPEDVAFQANQIEDVVAGQSQEENRSWNLQCGRSYQREEEDQQLS